MNGIMMKMRMFSPCWNCIVLPPPRQFSSVTGNYDLTRSLWNNNQRTYETDSGPVIRKYIDI